MGTGSSGLPWCEPGTHDHGVPGFSFQYPRSPILPLSQCFFLRSVARAGERGKAFRTTTCLVEE